MVNGYLRRLNPHLPRTVWLVQCGGVVNSFGNGVAFPFIVIYLHNVRGISFAVAGLALAVGGVAALFAGIGAGTLVDRIGGRNTLLLGLVLQATAFALFPLIREPWHAFALLSVEGAGTACFWPGQSTLLSRLASAEERSSAFSVQRITMNLGLGLGGLVGGLIATTSDPGSFTRLFLLDAATFFVFVGVLSTIREPAETEEHEEEAGGYRAVVRDRNFLGLLGLNVLFVAVGYEVFSLLAPFAKNYAGVSERWVGIIYLANTLAVVLVQLPVAKLLEGRRRMVALALMNAIWAVASLVVLAAGGLLSGTSAALVIVIAGAVFGIGETLQAPTQPPLVADLAPDRLRGRYFALGSMSWSVGGILGPAIGGALLGWHPLAVWPSAAAVCVIAVVGCLLLERNLPERVRRTPRREPVAPMTPLEPPLDLAPERL
jgi:predicted MFS family arabinose efflux permease